MQNIYSKYLEKQTLIPNYIKQPANADLKIAICIPASDEPDILLTIQSIEAGIAPECAVEIIVLINHQQNSSEAIKKQNIKTYAQLTKHQSAVQNIKTYPILIGNLPPKHAGAGLARKIAMDQAIQRLNTVDQKHGIIVSLDADTLVSTNYLFEIEQAFKNQKEVNCSIFNFEHSIDPNQHSEAHTRAIVLYEMYLRYYKLALRSTNFPYAYHTIGSCFAVSADTYVKQGGMNKKQAGEDFYFLQKVFPLNKTIELKQVTVYPSARPSNRVPFGTGPAIQKIANEGKLETYQWKTFKILHEFFAQSNQWHKMKVEQLKTAYSALPFEIKLFIDENEWIEQLSEINNNSTDLPSFTKRFYQWFNAFKVIKFLNHTHTNIHKKKEVQTEVVDFLGKPVGKKANEMELLELLRQIEK